MPKRRTTTEAPIFAARTPEIEPPKKSLKMRMAGYAMRAAAYTVVASSIFNAAGGNSPIHIDKAPTPETTYTQKTSSFVPIDVEQQPALLLTSLNHDVIEQRYAPEFTASALAPEQRAAVDSYMSDVVDDLRQDLTAKVTVRISGEASDEAAVDSMNDDANIGLPSMHNQRLAEQRGDLVYQQAIAYANSAYATLFGDRLTIEKAEAREVVLSETDRAAISAIAARRGMTNEAFMAQYNTTDRAALQLQPTESSTLATLIDDNRGAQIETFKKTNDIEQDDPCNVYVQQVDTEQQITQPGSDGRRIDIVPILPLVAMLRHRRKSKNTAIGAQSGYISTVQSVIQEVSARAQLHDRVGKTTELVSDKINDIRRVHRDRKSDVFAQEEYSALKRRYAKFGAVAVGLGALVAAAIPSTTVESDAQPTTIETACATVETTPEHTERTTRHFPVIEKVGKLLGMDLGRRFVVEEVVVPATVITTLKQHNVYTFDTSGNLIGSTAAPVQTR